MNNPLVISDSLGLDSYHEVQRAATQKVFANGVMRPFFPFGGVPIISYPFETTNVLLVGKSGSGKTTLLNHLLSYLLPLSTCQIERHQANQAAACPLKHLSYQDLSRAQTYQAIVYDAKDENVSFCAQLGFQPGVDMFILRPRDRRCYAPNFARDIADPQSIRQFARSVIPEPPHNSEKKDDVWLNNSRELVCSVINSFIKLAKDQGQEPCWTFADLIEAFNTEEALAQVLKHSPNPEGDRAHFLGYAAEQKSSILLSVRTAIRRFTESAALYRQAQQNGRILSLKDWLLHAPNSVLVLPNTKTDEDVYGPLNQLFYSLLAKWILDERYSKYIDSEGIEHVRKRVFVIDEIGNAGRIPEWDSLMTQGRSSGVNVIAAYQQNSQLRKTYGDDDMETILGKFDCQAFLKTDDKKTREYMSDQAGGKQLVYYKLGSSNSAVTVTSGNTKTEQETDSTGVTAARAHAQGDSVSTTKTDGIGEGTNTSATSGPKGQGSHTSGSHKNQNHSLAKQHSHNEQVTHTDSVQRNHASAHSQADSQSVAFSQSQGERDHLQERYMTHPDFFRKALPHPASTGLIGGKFQGPAGESWEHVVPYQSLLPKLVTPEAKKTVKNVEEWPNLWELSTLKGWELADYQRLGLTPPKPKVKRRPRIIDASIMPQPNTPLTLPHIELAPISTAPNDFQFEND